MPSSAPRRRDRESTYNALLTAARQRFAQQGYDGTTVRDIARDVGVDAALVFRYFGSKEDLFSLAMRGLTVDASALNDLPPSDAAAMLLKDFAFGRWPEFDGEHPIVAMLHSSGRPEVREQLCTDFTTDYLQALATSLGEDADLKAEILGSLLLGVAIMRSVLKTPALVQAEYDDVASPMRRIAEQLSDTP